MYIIYVYAMDRTATHPTVESQLAYRALRVQIVAMLEHTLLEGHLRGVEGLFESPFMWTERGLEGLATRAPCS
jgi:hypothetical protein